MSWDHELLRQVKPELDPNERVLWLGRPNARKLARRFRSHGLMGFFGTLICLMGIKAAFKDPLSMLIPGFFLAGAIGTMLTPWRMFDEALRTIYVVTNTRVFFFVAGRTRTVRSFAPSEIADITRTEEIDGTGDITFTRQFYRDGKGVQVEEIRLVGIADVRHVDTLLRATFPKDSE